MTADQGTLDLVLMLGEQAPIDEESRPVYSRSKSLVEDEPSQKNTAERKKSCRTGGVRRTCRNHRPVCRISFSRRDLEHQRGGLSRQDPCAAQPETARRS